VGAEEARNAHLKQAVDILGVNQSAHHHRDVVRAGLAQFAQ
jgi:hypothetical protein